MNLNDVPQAPADPLVHLSFDNPVDLGADKSGNDRHALEVNEILFTAAGVSGGAIRLTGDSSRVSKLGGAYILSVAK